MIHTGTFFHGKPLNVANARVTYSKTVLLASKIALFALRETFTAGLICPPDIPPEIQTPIAVATPHPTLMENQSYEKKKHLVLRPTPFEKCSKLLTPFGESATAGLVDKTT